MSIRAAFPRQCIIRPRAGLRAVIAVAALALLSLASARSQTAPPDDSEKLPVKPPPLPLGVVTLPQGPPPTGPQGSTPTPAAPLPRADRPLKSSPPLSAIKSYLEQNPITLRDAVGIALYTSRSFAASVAQLQEARGRTGQARAALIPTVGINGDLLYYDAATTIKLSASAPPFVITPQFNPDATAAFTVPIDVSGTIRAAASQAQFQEVAARIDVNRVRNQVVYDVKTAFYNVLRAQAQIGVAVDSVNNALTRLSDANKNYAAGTSPRFDVISAQRDVADAQQTLINARAQRSVSLAALKNTMGLGQETRLRITDAGAVEYPPGVPAPAPLPAPAPTGAGANPLTPPAPGPELETPQPQTAPPINTNAGPGGATAITITPLTAPSTGSVEDDFDFGPEYRGLLQEAVQSRPEVLEGDAQIAAAARGVQYARSSSLPSFKFTVSDTYTPNTTGFVRRNMTAFDLGISIPLFDAGLSRERVREARGVEARAEISKRQAVDQIQVDVQQAYVTLVQSRDRVAVANVELAQAQEAYRLALVRYNAGVSRQQGVSPQLELSNAQNTLTLAQTNQVNALYDYNNARAQLDHAVGRNAFTGAAPGYPSAPSPAIRGVPKRP